MRQKSLLKIDIGWRALVGAFVPSGMKRTDDDDGIDFIFSRV